MNNTKCAVHKDSCVCTSLCTQGAGGGGYYIFLKFGLLIQIMTIFALPELAWNQLNDKYLQHQTLNVMNKPRDE